ncbi:MAG: LysM peptidoglycan-binding domain-containing protein [Halanaerobiales bacterium]
MPNSLELANRILQRERSLNSLYGQLERTVPGQYYRTVQNLRRLQNRQLSFLNDLVDDLEEEQPPPPTTRRYAQHILQPGETLSVLAREYNVSVSEIRRVNPGLPPSPSPGQVVNLPIEIPQPPENSFRYIVRRGDTLFSIANRFDTTVEELVSLNSISDPDVIFPGRILIIPNN